MMLSGMQAGVGAVIASVVYDMGKGIVREKNMVSILIMLISFAAVYLLKVNVIFVVTACGIFGILKSVYETKRKKGGGS